MDNTSNICRNSQTIYSSSASAFRFSEATCSGCHYTRILRCVCRLCEREAKGRSGSWIYGLVIIYLTRCLQHLILHLRIFISSFYVVVVFLFLNGHKPLFDVPFILLCESWPNLIMYQFVWWLSTRPHLFVTIDIYLDFETRFTLTKSCVEYHNHHNHFFRLNIICCGVVVSLFIVMPVIVAVAVVIIVDCLFWCFWVDIGQGGRH